MSIWDDPEIRAGGEFVKLENPGDSISGTIQAIRAHRFDDGKVAPQILLLADSGEERTLTAGQVRLKAELAAQRPEAGDWIHVTLTQSEPRAGGKTLKHFAVEVRRGVGQPAQGQPTAPTVPGYAAPAQQWAPAAAQQYAAPAAQQWAQPAAPAPQQYAAPAAPAPQQYAAPAAPAPQQYAAPVAPPQAYAPPPAAPAPAAPAQPAAAPPAMTPEQQAAIAALPPEQQAAIAALPEEQRRALGWA